MLLFICLLSLLSGAKKNITVEALNNYEKRYEVLMNNVVNVRTPGYKSSTVITRLEGNELIAEVVPSYKSGPLVFSGDKYHIGIDGPGWFVLDSGKGYYLYTRDGRFKLTKSLELASLSGEYLLMGESGPVVLQPDEAGGINFIVSQEGLIVQNGEALDRLLVGELTNHSLMESIGGIFLKEKSTTQVKKKNRQSGPSQAFMPLDKFKVHQGYYENSNVEITSEIVNMPMVSKKYDANSKVLQIIKKSRQSAIEMGRAN